MMNAQSLDDGSTLPTILVLGKIILNVSKKHRRSATSTVSIILRFIDTNRYPAKDIRVINNSIMMKNKNKDG